MGLRFRKSIKIAPGVKVNLNKKSAGLTFGTKGFHHTINTKGQRTNTVGIPGTGISYTHTSKSTSKKRTLSSQSHGSQSKEKTNTSGTPPLNNNVFNSNGNNKKSSSKWYEKSGWILFFLIFFFPVGLFLMWKYSSWNKYIKTSISAIFAFLTLSTMMVPDVHLESASLKANANAIYDINENIEIHADFSPDNYLLTSSNIKTSGGKISVTDNTITFQSDTEGVYKIYMEDDGIRSNVISICIKDRGKLKEAKRKQLETEQAEQQRIAEQQRLEAEQAEQQRIAEQQRLEAEQAEQQRIAEQQRLEAEQAEQQRIAEQQRLEAEQQNSEDPIVYITETGKKYHSAGCRHLKKSQIPMHLSQVEGTYEPCSVCHPPVR